MRVHETKEGCVLKLSVKPGSREFKVIVEADDLVVLSREEPVKGKVNRELIKEFSRLFHKEVRLVSGFSSREKRLLVKGAKKDEVEAALRRS